MAHKTLIDGVTYEIDGGKAMVDGTVYEIDKGTTLVDGTAYEVGFASDPVITIKTTANNGASEVWGWVTIDGKKYGGPNSDAAVEVPVGTIIRCTASKYSSMGRIYLNGVIVANQTSGVYVEYDYTATTNAIIEIKGNADNSDIYITEIRNDPAMLTIQKASGKDPYSGNTISADATYAKVTINGAVYDGSSEVKLVLPAGTVIGCYVKTQKNGIANVEVWSGGKRTRVAEADTSGASTTYAYTVTGDATILVSRQYFSYDRSYFGTITITET